MEGRRRREPRARLDVDGGWREGSGAARLGGGGKRRRRESLAYVIWAHWTVHGPIEPVHVCSQLGPSIRLATAVRAWAEAGAGSASASSNRRGIAGMLAARLQPRSREKEIKHAQAPVPRCLQIATAISSSSSEAHCTREKGDRGENEAPFSSLLLSFVCHPKPNPVSSLLCSWCNALALLLLLGIFWLPRARGVAGLLLLLCFVTLFN